MEPMSRALDLARQAADAGEAPIGAVVADASGRIIAEARNRVEELSDPTAHAEILAMRAAGAALRSSRLMDCDLYVTLEPCPMCAGAIAHARLRRLIFGAYDPKGGGVEHGARVFDRSTCHHRPEIIGGVRESESRELLRAFFQERR